ncbi:MAG: DUF4382 domain-containing protein [Halioglobus sp.]|nr:DUF4382 domain-containing protein [Halioglobus sp.]
MARSMSTAAAALLYASLAALGGCTCGFDCSSDDEESGSRAVLDLRLSDASPEDLKEVVIDIESITLQRGGGDDVEIERFSVPRLGISNEDNVPVDLLQFRGENSVLLVDDLEIDADDYNDIVIAIRVDDPNNSYVLEDDDTLRELTVSGGRLVLPGVRLTEGDENLTIEFDLALSLRYEAASERYRLTSDGVRVVDNTRGATLAGSIDTELFDRGVCDDKIDPEQGNRVYLYEGHGLDAGGLADVHRSDSARNIPADAVAPIAVASVFSGNSDTWRYEFGALAPGNYTVAFSCDTEDDDARDYDGITVPLPAEQLYEVRLDSNSAVFCDIEDDSNCG